MSLYVCVCICCRQRRQTSRNAKRRGRARSRQQIDDSDVDCGARLALLESSTRHDSTRHDAVTPAATIVVNCAKSSTGCHIAHTRRSQHVDNLPAYSARSLALALALSASVRESHVCCSKQLLSTELNNMFKRLAGNTDSRHTGTLSRSLSLLRSLSTFRAVRLYATVCRT